MKQYFCQVFSHKKLKPCTLFIFITLPGGRNGHTNFPNQPKEYHRQVLKSQNGLEILKQKNIFRR